MNLAVLITALSSQPYQAVPSHLIFTRHTTCIPHFLNTSTRLLEYTLYLNQRSLETLPYKNGGSNAGVVGGVYICYMILRLVGAHARGSQRVLRGKTSWRMSCGRNAPKQECNRCIRRIGRRRDDDEHGAGEEVLTCDRCQRTFCRMGRSSYRYVNSMSCIEGVMDDILV